jgi:hypothetical protein
MKRTILTLLHIIQTFTLSIIAAYTIYGILQIACAYCWYIKSLQKLGA